MTGRRPNNRRTVVCALALCSLVVTSLAVGCSSSQQGDSQRITPRAQPEPPQRVLSILSDWFQDLPTPVPAVQPFVQGSSTIVVLPDTQVYAELYPEIFERQTRWIADHRHERDIRFALHLGDITEHGNQREWESAVDAMRWLDGRVPYALVGGNHDYGRGGNAESRDSLLSTYFPVRKFRDGPTFGGTYNADVLDNSYHLFSAGGREWIAVMLEWGPRKDVVEWADKVLSAYPNRTAIVVTHAYLFDDGTRYDQAREDQPWNPHHYGTAKLPGGVFDGQELWDTLINEHGNVAMVLSGHVLGDGTGLLSSKGKHGNTVHQMLSNYQMLEEGGRGYLRLLEILPGGNKIQVKTYSPWIDDYLTDQDQQFEIDIDVRLSEDANPIREASPELSMATLTGD